MNAKTPTQHLAASINKKMAANGTLARIDARKEQHTQAAKTLGYASAQEAFNKMGKGFLAFANAYVAPAEPVAKAVEGFTSLIRKGWETDLAFECSYDGVYDLIGKEAFLDRCQAAIKSIASAASN